MSLNFDNSNNKVKLIRKVDSKSKKSKGNHNDSAFFRNTILLPVFGVSLYELGKYQGKKESKVVVNAPFLDVLRKMMEHKPCNWTHTRKYYFIKFIDGLMKYNVNGTNQENAETLVRYAMLAFFPKDEEQALTLHELFGSISADKLGDIAENISNDTYGKIANKIKDYGDKSTNVFTKLFATAGHLSTVALSKLANFGFKKMGTYLGHGAFKLADWYTGFNDELFLQNKGEIGIINSIKNKLSFGLLKNYRIPGVRVGKNVFYELTKEAVKNISGCIPILAEQVKKYGLKSATKVIEDNKNTENSVPEVGLEDKLKINSLNVSGLLEFIYTVFLSYVGDSVSEALIPNKMKNQIDWLIKGYFHTNAVTKKQNIWE